MLFNTGHLEDLSRRPELALYLPFGFALAAIRSALWIAGIALDAPWFRNQAGASCGLLARQTRGKPKARTGPCIGSAFGHGRVSGVAARPHASGLKASAVVLCVQVPRYRCRPLRNCRIL